MTKGRRIDEDEDEDEDASPGFGGCADCATDTAEVASEPSPLFSSPELELRLLLWLSSLQLLSSLLLSSLLRALRRLLFFAFFLFFFALLEAFFGVRLSRLLSRLLFFTDLLLLRLLLLLLLLPFARVSRLVRLSRGREFDRDRDRDAEGERDDRRCLPLLLSVLGRFPPAAACLRALIEHVPALLACRLW